MFRYVFTALWLQLSIPESTKKGCSIYCFKKNNHYNHLYENVKYVFFLYPSLLDYPSQSLVILIF